MSVDDRAPQFSPLGAMILDGIEDQVGRQDMSMVTETVVDVTGGFDVEELAKYIRGRAGHPNPETGK